MHYLKQTLVASIICLGLAMSSSSIAETASQAAQDQAAMQKYNEQLFDALLAEGTPRAIVLAASSLSYVDKSSRAPIDKRRRDLLDRAAQMAPDDAWVQWRAAISMPPSDTLSEPALALQRLVPDNGAVWLFQLQVAARARDAKGVTDALKRIGSSRFFDDYFMTSATEWRKFLVGYPLPEPYRSADEKTTQKLVMTAAASRAAAIAMMDYNNPIRACKSAGQPLTADRRDACLAAGRLMLNQSHTLLTMSIGAVLLRSADAKDAFEITRNTEYFTEEYGAAVAVLAQDPDQYERYQTDWMQSRNEVQFGKELLARAGIPLTPPEDWKSNQKRIRSRIAALKKN